MYMSSAAKPVNQPDALHLLLNRVHGGGDATLIADGDAAGVLLDLAADCLSGRRTRVLWAAEVLPSRLTAGVPDDDALSQSFQAMTVLDGECDRIVLLIEDAHALKRSALRYIQLAGRTAAHLQLVFCGTRAFFDLVNAEEFTWLRTRLATGLVLTLAAPIIEGDEEDAPPVPASVPDRPAAWAGVVATPLPVAHGPAVSTGRRSWPLWLGALALLGLGGMGGFMLAAGGGAGRPAARQQAASVVQSPALPNAPAPGMPPAGNAPRADRGPVPTAVPDAPSQPAAAGEAQGAGPGPGPRAGVPAAPPSAKAPGARVTVWAPPRAAAPEAEPRPEAPPSLARSLGRPGAPAASSRAAAAQGSRARRPRDLRDEPAPPREDQWAPPEPAFGSWTAPVSPPTRYIGSYATDANGIRVFHPEP